MLQLVLGRAGTGKSRFMLDVAAKCPVEDLVLIVPEQFTMETEKRLLEAKKSDALPAFSVTSFSGMALQYHTDYGKSGTYIDNFGRHILMDRALRAQNSALTVYGGRVTRSLTDAFLSVASELKTSRLTPEDLMEQAQRHRETALGDKLHDISLVVSDYQARMEENYLDSLDDLTLLADGIRQHGLYRKKTVLLDGFHNFSAQEEEVIAALMTQADRVMVALPCSGLTDTGEEGDAPLFENVREEARRLVGLAHRMNIPVERPILLKENKRAKTEALRLLETSLIGSDKGTDDCNGIHLYNASSLADEVMLLTALVKQRIKESGCRYRDCAVVARSLSDYETLLPEAFHRAGIPLYMDSREDITLLPLFTLMTSALQVAAGERWDENLFRCLKTGFFPVSMDEIYNLENYVLMWGLGKGGMTEPFTLHPRGYADDWREEDRECLTSYEKTRQVVMAPLLSLCRELHGHFSGKTFCRALYRFLLTLDVPGQIDEKRRLLSRQGDPVRAGEQVRLWEYTVHLLDQMDATVGEDTLDARSALELFRVACQGLDMGRIPPTVDAVTVGSADRVRMADVKHVYILGCNEGIFPAAPSGTGLLTDRDRETIKEQGIRLGGDSAYWSVEEMFIAYKAFSAPSESLTLLYRRLSSSGEKLRPSTLIHRIKKCFPTLKETAMEDLSPLVLATDPTAAMTILALRRKKTDPETAALRQIMGRDERYGPILDAMAKHTRSFGAKIVDEETAAALFNRDHMRISATKLENYHRCPYSYFLQYGLRLNPREKATLKANTIGTMIHFVLEKALKELSERDIASITPQEKTACVDKWCAYYYQTSMGGDTGKNAAFVYRYHRLRTLAQAIMDNLLEEMKQAKYRPVAFEMKIGKDGEAPPYLVSCKKGTVAFEGTVDRVDTMEGEPPYVRVVDYKTNSKKFAMSDLLYGQNMQMLIYLSALRKDASSFSAYLPGGVLYFPAAQATNTTDAGDDGDQGDNGMKMNGVLLDDLPSLMGMEQELNGRFIPPKMGKNGPSGGILVSEDDIKTIDAYIDRTLRRMHEGLCKGEIGALPTDDPCRYCKYRAVCDHDSSVDGRIEKMKFSTQEVLDCMKELVAKEEGECHASMDTATEGSDPR